MPDLDARAARLAAAIYTGISLTMAALFLAGTLLTGRSYTAADRIGGAIWVFILSMIITMPLVIPYVKKKAKG